MRAVQNYAASDDASKIFDGSSICLASYHRSKTVPIYSIYEFDVRAYIGRNIRRMFFDRWLSPLPYITCVPCI